MRADPEFDLRAYAGSAHGSLRAQLSLEGVEPADAGTLHLLGSLHTLEGATMQWLRSVLVTATHKDARVTAFLVTWAYEKYWIADAIGAMIEAGGGVVPSADTPARERGTVLQALRGLVDGPSIVGAHLRVTVESDRMLDPAYARLVERMPTYSRAVDVVGAVKARQREFLEAEASARHETGTKAKRLTRRELARWPLPLGIDALAPVARRELLSALEVS